MQPRRHGLQHVAEVSSRASGVACFQTPEQGVGVRSALGQILIGQAEEHGRGDAEGGLADHIVLHRADGQGLHGFAPSAHPCGAARQAEGHVAAAFGGQRRKGPGVQGPAMEIIERPQDRCAVRAASRQTGLIGDALDDADRQAAVGQPGAPEEGLRRLPGEVPPVRGQVQDVSVGADAHQRPGLAGAEGEIHLVAERHGLHQHIQLVIPVRAKAQDVQRQVQLRRSQNMDRVHFWIMRASR